jgi:hypothetical protein
MASGLGAAICNMHGVDQVTKIAAQSVKLPEHLQRPGHPPHGSYLPWFSNTANGIRSSTQHLRETCFGVAKYQLGVEQLSNVVDDGLLRQRWFVPPYRQIVPQQSPLLTAASRLTAAISSPPTNVPV